MALFDEDTTEDTTEVGVASYLVAADSHSIANDNQSFLESAAETVSNIPKFIGTSIISGANQLYNIAPTLGNFMGGDFEISKTADVVEAIDDDLGVYYQEHGESADVAGFLISSLVPGIGGIKLLNAGQKVLATANATGRFGNNMARGFGLLRTKREEYLTKAISEVTNSNSLSLITNKNTVLAMGAGYGQAVLEMAAFETATAVALSESPVLEGQDIGDIMTNIAVGGLVFGTIGGVIDVTKTAFAVKKAVKAADTAAAPWTHINVLHTGATPSNKLLYDLEQFDNLKQIPIGVLTPEREAFLRKAAATKARRLQVQARSSLGELAAGDQVIADQAYAMTLGADFNTQLGNYLGTTRISRVLDKTAPEKIISKVEKRLEKGKATIEEVEEAAALEFRATYVDMWGESIGNTVDRAPQHIALADTLKKGQSITIDGNKVVAGDRQFNFDTKGIRSDARVGNTKELSEAKATLRAAERGELGAADATRVLKAQEVVAKSKKAAAAKGTGWDVTKVGLHEAQARNMWAMEAAPLAEAGENFKPVTIGEMDTPLLDQLYREFNAEHKVLLEDGSLMSFEHKQELLDFIHTKKIEIANKFLTTKAGKGKSQDDIASMLNMRSSRLSGEVSEDLTRDIFALESYAKDYTNMLVEKGLHDIEKGIIPVYKLPKTMKLSYDTTAIKDIDGNVLEGMATITQQERLQSQKLQNILAGYFADDADKFLELSVRDVLDANRVGAGGKFFTAASSNYGSLAAKVEYIGQATAGVISRRQAALREAIEPSMYRLAQNQEAVVEWSTLNATLRALPDNYVLNEAGTALEPAVMQRYNQMVAEGLEARPPKLHAKDAPLEIPIENAETLELIEAHISQNGRRMEHIIELRTAQGVPNKRNPDVFYPTPVEPKDYPFFALVKDDSITGTGHTKTLYANSQEQLDSMISELADKPSLTILTKTDAENYYKSIGQFDSTRTLNDNYLNITLHRKGVSAPYFVPTDPAKVTQDLLAWHLKQETSLVREMVSAKYERQFEELRKRGEEFTNLATSQFNSAALVKHAENVVKNPYMDYIKTSLGIKNYSDYPFWINANKMLDAKVSEMFDRMTKVVESSKSVEELSQVNAMMKSYGYKGAAYDMEMDLLANHTAPRGVLQSFVQKANSILATVVLRLDHLNAVNNYISANILYGAEMKSIIRAIEGSNTNAVGELAGLGKIKLPGSEQALLSPTKLLANAYKAFGKDSPDLAFFKENGFVTSISDQYKWTLDNLTLSGKETVKDLSSKITTVHDSLRNAATKGERWTGNRLAEEFNRFAAAHTMKQVTDIAIKHGLMDSKTALSYINTFVNRTQGNYLAAQRPMLFQGAVGQSIGLFQTYQFNLMQQLLRHVGEGTAKDSMTLLGLQGTVFGMNGLPAFNAINTHIVGTASGNEKHRDFYTTVYGAAGKDAGDWLMYGLASNMLLHPDLKTNLYVRGDINPRHVTIVPTDPASVPIIQATSKFIKNIYDTGSKIANGGDFISSVLQGLEHNSISRPLAGLAQTLEGLANPEHASYSTSKRGNVIASNDVLALTNISRMVGGKPLGEAVAIDAAFRFKAYALADSAKRAKLGEAIKSSMIAGRSPSQEQIESFAESYAKTGGKQTEFNKWMVQLYKTTNTSQANDLRDKVNSPYSKSMQLIMGGYELKDFDR